MTQSSKALLTIGIVISIVGMTISAGAQLPQVGLKVFVIGFGLFVAGLLHSHLAGWWQNRETRKRPPLGIAMVGFGLIALVQILAVLLVIPDSIVLGGTVLGSIFMLVGIGLHIGTIGS
jgi:hypothetical protein